MKINLPIRETLIVFSTLCICFFSNDIYAQCGSCPSPTQTLDGCPGNGGIYDLTSISITSGNTAKFYERCNGSGPNTEITGDLTMFEGDDDSDGVIYVEELDGSDMCDTIFSVTLNELSITGSISLNPASGDFCSGNSVTLTASVDPMDNGATYMWTKPDNSTSMTNPLVSMQDGEHTVVITSQGCELAPISETINEQSISIANTVRTNVTCFGLMDGTFSVTVTGGSGTYTYLLSNGNSPDGGDDDDKVTFSGLDEGSYTVMVTDDGGAMCTVTSSPALNITEPADVTMNLTGVPPTMIGAGDGKIDVERQAGTANYNWNITGEEMKNGSVGSPNFFIMDLDPGDYNVTVTDDDGNGCPATGMVTVPNILCNISITNTSGSAPDCFNGGNGSVSITTNNYTGNYIIEWEGEETGDDPVNTTDTEVIENLDPGDYSFTVTDALGCSSSVANVTVPNAPQITFSLSQAQAACSGVSNGIIQVNNITNGTPNYIVSWNGPGSNDDMLPPSSNTNPQITGLPSGSYSVTIQDSNGCAPLAQSQTIDVLPSVSVTIVGDDVFCFDEDNGTLSTTPNNFVSYMWSTNASTPSINIENPGASSVNYLVTVTDNSGCTGSDVISVERLDDITISLNTSASKTSVTCDSDCDGRIDINKGGGMSPYTYQWSGPMGFSRTTEDIEDLCPGDYSVTITDSEGCTKTFSQNISVPQTITAQASASDATCDGDTDGSVTVSASGGTPGYTYLWTPGNFTTQTVNNLGAGTYTVRVTDSNGCFKTSSAVVNDPPPVVGTITPSSAAICDEESISLTASGGTSYLWSNNLGTDPEIDVSPSSTTTYNVIVTDAATNNCTDVASVTVIVHPLPTASITPSETSGLNNNDSEICEGDAITLIAQGGTSYNWQGGQPNPLTVSPSNNETYSVTVTDANGCTDTESISVLVNENPTPIIDFSAANQTVQDIQNISSNSVANCGTLIECDWTTEDASATGDCDGISPTFTSQGSKNITLEVLNSCGCSETITDVLEIFASDQCAVEQFTVNNSLGIACVGEQLDIQIGERATPNCVIEDRDFDVFRNGVLLSLGNEYEYDVNTITFNTPGSYEMKYTISDNCGCSRPSTRFIDIIPAPSISFSSGNITTGCEGESINVSFSGFNSGEKVDVQYSNGNVFTYEVDNFDFQLGANETETLTILSVQNSTCEVPVSNQTLEISVTPKFRVVSQTANCTDDGLSYTLTIKTEGGEPSESIIADGIAGTNSGADNYVIPNLDPTKEYSFTMRRGDECDPIPVNLPMIICNCTFFVGDNTSSGFSGCEDDVFDISNIFQTSDDFDEETDTLIYFLHDQGTGLSLGNVYQILPSSATTLSSDFTGFIPNFSNYRLSVVGFRKATLGDFDFDNLQSFRGLGSSRCLSVVSGIPVVWFATPSPQLGTADNSNTICRNAYDYMIFAKNTQVGSNITFEVEGQSTGNINSYGFQDTAFVYFEDNGQDSFNIIITESKEYFDGSNTFTCEGQTVVTLYVKDGPGSPPRSEVILWPGNILASTADSMTTCYEWGFINFGQFSGILGTEKFLYAASDINFETTTRTYFVDTYLCDNPDCVTRIFYNADGPSPGLNYKREESFSYLIKPNPNDGLFTLDLFSDLDGDYNLRVIDLNGKPVLNRRTTFKKGKNSEEFNIPDVPKGIYFIQIVNIDTNEYSIDKVIIN